MLLNHRHIQLTTQCGVCVDFAMQYNSYR